MVFNNYEEYKKLSGVYLIINLKNNFVYVGATSSEFRLRYQTHKSYLRNNKHYNKELQSDYNKYGEDYFVFEVAEIKTKIIQGEKDSDIAKKFGVSEGCISNIRYGYRWEYLIVDGWEEYQNNRKRRKTYTEEEIFNIKKDILDGKNNSYINKKYRISYDKINSIRKDM